MSSLEAFGQRIRTLRTEKNITQQELADRMFVSRKTIGNWESGSRLPDISMLARLARNLGIETWELVDILYDGNEEPPIVIVVEKEPIILKAFVQLIDATLQEAQVFGFDSFSEAHGSPPGIASPRRLSIRSSMRTAASFWPGLCRAYHRRSTSSS